MAAFPNLFQVPGMQQAPASPVPFPMLGTPVSQAPQTPAPEAGNGFGLGNNLPTWLAAIALLGGAAQPTRVGETATGNFGKAMIGAANTFASAKSGEAKGKLEERTVGADESRARTSERLAGTEDRKVTADMQANAAKISEQMRQMPQNLIDADVKLKEAQAWALRNPQASGKGNASEAEITAANDEKWIADMIKKGVYKDWSDAKTALMAARLPNPGQLGTPQRNVDVIVKGAGAGLTADDMLPTITDPGINAATKGYSPIPAPGTPDHKKYLQLLSTTTGVALAFQEFGEAIFNDMQKPTGKK